MRLSYCNKVGKVFLEKQQTNLGENLVRGGKVRVRQLHSVHSHFLLGGGEGGGVEPPNKFSKRGP